MSDSGEQETRFLEENGFLVNLFLPKLDSFVKILGYEDG